MEPVHVLFLRFKTGISLFTEAQGMFCGPQIFVQLSVSVRVSRIVLFG